MRLKNTKGQSLVEYTIVIGVIVLVAIAMTPMIRRSLQSFIKSVADQVGNQQESDQEFTRESGHLEEAYSSTRTEQNKRTRERSGKFTYTYNDLAGTDSVQQINLGFTEQPGL